MNCEILLVQVENRPAIWDASDTLHYNRGHLDKLWDEIRRKVGASKDKCRKKWKYLRDRFRAELRKEQMALESGHNKSTEFKSTFPYFQQMSFLRSQMWFGKTEPKTFYDIPIAEEAYEPYVEYEESNDSNAGQFKQNVSYQNYEQATDDNPYSTSTEYLVPSVVAEPSDSIDQQDACKVPKLKLKLQKKSKKRKYTKRLLEIEDRKTELLAKIEASNQMQQKESEDLLFFKSLLGYMESFTPAQNLRVRNQIQSVILDEIDASVNYYPTRNSKNRL